MRGPDLLILYLMPDPVEARDSRKRGIGETQPGANPVKLVWRSVLSRESETHSRLPSEKPRHFKRGDPTFSA